MSFCRSLTDHANPAEKLAGFFHGPLDRFAFWCQSPSIGRGTFDKEGFRGMTDLLKVVVFALALTMLPLAGMHAGFDVAMADEYDDLEDELDDIEADYEDEMDEIEAEEDFEDEMDDIEDDFEDEMDEIEEDFEDDMDDIDDM